MEGYVHSIDSFGTVDGPGIRMILFLQGCPLRCGYCHNPDTWKINVGKRMTDLEILEKYDTIKEYTTGGITVTGGEPLIQMDFVTSLFNVFKKKDIHTCLDTLGATFGEGSKDKFDELMKVTDLVLLDIKHIDSNQHRLLTGMGNEKILSFAEYLSEIKKDVWIRHVAIEGITLVDEYLLNLGKFLSRLKNIKALDIIPYHTMAIEKYRSLKMQYPLEGIQATTTERTAHALNMILHGIKREKEKNR